MLLNELRVPQYYNENVLIMLVQKPDAVFAYWELSGHQWNALRNKDGLYLRLYSCQAENGPDLVEVLEEVKLPVNCKNWYFNGLAPVLEYYTELGWKTTDNLFMPILRSDPVVTPPNRPDVKSLQGGKPAIKTIVLSEPGGRVTLPVATVLESMVCYMGIKVV
ncbi:MAG: DUF4912 domain-containing protein [Bacillota bacterium]